MYEGVPQKALRAALPVAACCGLFPVVEGALPLYAVRQTGLE